MLPPPKEQSYWQWKESVIVPVRRKGDITLCINNQGLLLTSYIKIFIQCSFLRLTPHVDIIILQILKKKGIECSMTSSVFDIRLFFISITEITSLMQYILYIDVCELGSN